MSFSPLPAALSLHYESLILKVILQKVWATKWERRGTPLKKRGGGAGGGGGRGKNGGCLSDGVQIRDLRFDMGNWRENAYRYFLLNFWPEGVLC